MSCQDSKCFGTDGRMTFNNRKPVGEATGRRLSLSEIFFLEQRVALMLFSRESFDILACTFFSNLNFAFFMLKVQTQRNLILSSEQFQLKHLFKVRINSLCKSTVLKFCKLIVEVEVWLLR